MSGVSAAARASRSKRQAPPIKTRSTVSRRRPEKRGAEKPAVSTTGPEGAAPATREAADKGRDALAKARAGASGPRVSIVAGFPKSVPPRIVRPPLELFGRYASEAGALSKIAYFEGPGFVGLDAGSGWDDRRLLALGDRFRRERLRAAHRHHVLDFMHRRVVALVTLGHQLRGLHVRRGALVRLDLSAQALGRLEERLLP